SLVDTDQTRGTQARAIEEWKKKVDTAKTPQERERVLHTPPSNKVRARLDASSTGTSLQLRDANGASATLGETTLKYPATGVTEQRPASSLVLFDKGGNVLWEVPQ